MKRRSFLGFLGGAVASGPSAVTSVAEVSNKLSLDGLATPKPHTPPLSWKFPILSDPKEFAKRSLLEEFEECLPEHLERKRSEHKVSALDPNIASLRSVSLSSKIRMTRDFDFERSRERRKHYLMGIIEGWWT